MAKPWSGSFQAAAKTGSVLAGSQVLDLKEQRSRREGKKRNAKSVQRNEIAQCKAQREGTVFHNPSTRILKAWCQKGTREWRSAGCDLTT